MAMLPDGFKSFSTQGSYETSEKVTSEGRGGAPKHNPEGYHPLHIGPSGYGSNVSDAAKSEDTKKGGTDHNTSKAPAEVSLAISEPAAYSRDWSNASK